MGCSPGRWYVTSPYYRNLVSDILRFTLNHTHKVRTRRDRRPLRNDVPLTPPPTLTMFLIIFLQLGTRLQIQVDVTDGNVVFATGG